jgi:hypothetical protein
VQDSQDQTSVLDFGQLGVFLVVCLRFFRAKSDVKLLLQCFHASVILQILDAEIRMTLGVHARFQFLSTVAHMKHLINQYPLALMDLLKIEDS